MAATTPDPFAKFTTTAFVAPPPAPAPVAAPIAAAVVGPPPPDLQKVAFAKDPSAAVLSALNSPGATLESLEQALKLAKEVGKLPGENEYVVEIMHKMEHMQDFKDRPVQMLREECEAYHYDLAALMKTVDLATRIGGLTSENPFLKKCMDRVAFLTPYQNDPHGMLYKAWTAEDATGASVDEAVRLAKGLAKLTADDKYVVMAGQFSAEFHLYESDPHTALQKAWSQGEVTYAKLTRAIGLAKRLGKLDDSDKYVADANNMLPKLPGAPKPAGEYIQRGSDAHTSPLSFLYRSMLRGVRQRAAPCQCPCMNRVVDQAFDSIIAH